MAADRARQRVGELCRLLIVFRLATLAVTVVYIPLRGSEAPELSAALVLAALASYLSLRYWDRLADPLLRHPSLLAADLALTLAILVVAGPGSPLLYYSLATTAVAGLAYSWTGGAFFCVLTLLGYAGVLALRSAAGADIGGFQNQIGFPALYALTALGGIMLRRMTVEQAETEAGLAEVALRNAASEERSRVAREMHDSLAKTLHGISLSATALAVRVERDPAVAVKEARLLAAAAERAADEARGLIVDLRADQLEASLGDAVRDYAASWSRTTGIPVALEVDGVELRSPSARYELFRILREALDNAERHAGAGRVTVTVAPSDAGLELRVADDGVGLEPSADLRELEPDGHFGLIGIAERADRVGGHAEVRASPGGGTTVVVVVPTKGDDLVQEASELA